MLTITNDIVEDKDYKDLYNVVAFRRTMFTNCNFKNGFFRTDSVLENVSFKNCDMRNVDFEHIALKDVRFYGCDLTDASFCHLPQDSIIYFDEACKLDDATFNWFKGECNILSQYRFRNHHSMIYNHVTDKITIGCKTASYSFWMSPQAIELAVINNYPPQAIRAYRKMIELIREIN